MGALLARHAARLLANAKHLSTPNKYLLAIAGCPGSGKTTAAGKLRDMVLDLAQQQNIPEAKVIAQVVSMDGFHYYRKELDAMSNPKLAHARRGAHWTFNAGAFVQAIESLRRTGEGLLPSFDHAYGDPIEEDVQILPETKLVIIEGNYLLLDEAPWMQLRDSFDESWYIDCDIDIAMSRVLGRQIKNGSPKAVAEKRVNSNDRPNAKLIAKSGSNADLTLSSTSYS